MNLKNKTKKKITKPFRFLRKMMKPIVDYYLNHPLSFGKPNH